MAQFQYQSHAEPIDGAGQGPSKGHTAADSGTLSAPKVVYYQTLSGPVSIGAAAPPAFTEYWTPVYPDRPTRYRPLIQSVQNEPIFVSDTQFLGWTPRYPARYLSPRRVTVFNPFEEPVYVPDVTNPPPDLDGLVPSYPDRVYRNVVRAAVQRALFWNNDTPLARPDFWTPGYPDRVVRNALLTASQKELFWNTDTPVQPPAYWTPAYPNRLDRARSLNGSFKTDPEFNTLPAPELSWTPWYPDRNVYRKPIEHPAWFAPYYVPDVTYPVTPLSWRPDYPERVRKSTLPIALYPTLSWITDTPIQVAALRAQGESGMVGGLKHVYYQGICGPVSIPVPPVYNPVNLEWEAKYPAFIRRKLSNAKHEPGHRVFNVVTNTPVMSWESYTALYPARILRAPRVRLPEVVRSYDTTQLAPAPDLVLFVGPHRLVRKLRVPEMPHFFTTWDTTQLAPAPDLVLFVGPNRLDRKKTIQPLYFFTTLDTSQAAAYNPNVLDWRYAYPDRIFSKFRYAVYEPGHRVFSVITNTPVMAWENYTALYPARINRTRAKTPVLSILNPVEFPARLISEWKPEYPARVYRRPPTTLLGSVSAPVGPTPIAISNWASTYPVRVSGHRPRFILSGTVAPLIRNYVLVADSGIYIWNGTDVELIWTGQTGRGKLLLLGVG